MIKKKLAKRTLKTKSSTVSIKEYTNVLLNIKNQIRQSQVKAALAANKELIKLYWNIGRTIAEKQKESGWGSSVIERLANDLQKEFLIFNIPWFHNVIIVHRLKNTAERLWYAQKAIVHGWSRSVLEK